MKVEILLPILLSLLLAVPVAAQDDAPAAEEKEAPAEKKEAPAVTEEAEPAGETAPAPLVIAEEAGPKIEFQIGADLMGGGLAGLEFVGGVNVTLVYPVLDLLWVGIRPGLHYAFVDDSPYDETWLNADAILQFNILHDPVRLYALVSGGYAFALDTDHYNDLAHGYGAAGGIGVAWKPEDSKVGLFLELGFRYGAATKESTRLVLDEDGDPIYEPDTLSWQSEDYDRKFQLTAFTVNVGLTVSP